VQVTNGARRQAKSPFLVSSRADLAVKGNKMLQPPLPEETLPTMAQLNPLLSPYQKANVSKAVRQVITSVIPYFVLWYAMIRALEVSYWLTLGLAVIAAGFLVRIFIIFHDCGHNSFLPSKRANKRLGFWMGVLTFTPGEQWWHSHAVHHATSGNLDKRGEGDVTTLTLEEFYDTTWLSRLGYRFFRNPLVMFILGPIFMFFIMHRLPLPRYGKKETASVIWTNLAILGIATGMSLLIGLKAYLIIQVPVMVIAGMGGIWLFYVQHQFEGVYWERDEEWNYVASALLGASFLRLPRVLQWFSGNIGYHHIHHLSPRIPNYNLEQCHENSALFKRWARVLTAGDAFRATALKLWDESIRKLVGFPSRGQIRDSAASAVSVRRFERQE
jgi:omega-6 fatty acid desaturase (delta-12 desaturase)